MDKIRNLSVDNELSEEDKKNKLYKTVLEELTDIKVNTKKFEDIEKYPNKAFLEVNSEVMDIIYELQLEHLYEAKRGLNEQVIRTLTALNLKKAKELLFKRAEIVIPKKLREVADRVGASFKKCEIVMSQKGWLAMNCYRGSKMLFCATNVQLPEKSLEALCIHELAHNYVLRHDSAFYKKMIELGGEEAYKLDQALFKEGKWPYLKF